MAVTDKDNAKLPTQGHTPTGMGILISGAKNTDQDVVIPKWTTLNEKYGIMADEAIGTKSGSEFSLKWFGIGIKGSKCIGETPEGIERRRILDHTATDFSAFLPIPFVIREISNDLSEQERENYRMRVLKKIGDKTYALYYLRAIKFDVYDPKMKLGYKDPETGNNKEDPYTPKEEDIKPTPYTINSNDSIPVTNRYLTATGTLNLTLEANELDELRNVCRILFGDASVAAVSEVYLVHGIDTYNTNAQIGSGGTAKIKELCPACVSYQITEMYARDANSNNRLKLYFEYGNSVSYLTELKATETIE